jgi:hypothetical protein
MGHRGQSCAVRGRPGLFVALGHPRFFWRSFVPGSRYLDPYPYTVIRSAGDLPLSVVR